LSVDLVLKPAPGGPSIDPESVAQALSAISTPDGLKCALGMEGLTIRIGVLLPTTDAGTARVAVSFKARGQGLTASTGGGGSSLLYWCVHALAAQLSCKLFDPQAGKTLTPNAAPFLTSAKALVAASEEQVLAERAYAQDLQSNAASNAVDAAQALIGFLDGLVVAEQLSLNAPAGDLTQLSAHLQDPSGLYEALMDSPLVDDVFLSESQFVRSLARYLNSR